MHHTPTMLLNVSWHTKQIVLLRVQDYLHQTEVLTSSSLNSLLKIHVLFKAENFQKSGQFQFQQYYLTNQKSIILYSSDEIMNELEHRSCQGPNTLHFRQLCDKRGVELHHIPTRAETAKEGSLLQASQSSQPCKTSVLTSRLYHQLCLDYSASHHDRDPTLHRSSCAAGRAPSPRPLPSSRVGQETLQERRPWVLRWRGSSALVSCLATQIRPLFRLG